MRIALFCTLVISAISTIGACAEGGRDLPAKFVANRVFLIVRTISGETVDFYTDSGGGTNLMCRSTAQRLKLATAPFADEDDELGKNIETTHLAAFARNAGIPVNADGDDRFLVHDCNERDAIFGNAFLSSRWFADRMWTWNYAAGTLRLEGKDFRPPPSAHKIDLAFQIDNVGKRRFNMARMSMRVDGKSIDMLLDTGATTTLTPAALREIADNFPATRATSFIGATIFDAWHAAHPNWRVIEGAEQGTGFAIIEVPDVEIASAHVGPVWFTYRRDASFHQFMAPMMDKQIEGAIGGDAFNHFVMTIDYPNAVAYFRCVKDCKPD